jgi:ABC-2 type transport system permease protein
VKRAFVIARRELAAYFFAPVSYVVAMLFLLVEGYSFWLFLELLNGRDTPHGAVMQYFFGGTFLYWLFLMFLVAVLTMRLIAEEKRSGTLEPLLTSPVEDWQVIVGKYLGALGFWIALWLPTLLYVIVLGAHAPDGARPDLGPIAAGYLGTFLVGASALAIGLCASALSPNQILAAVISFVVLAMMLLVGALGDALVRTGPWSKLLQYIDLFRHMEDFGRGIVDSRRIVYHAGWIALGLFGATRALARRRSNRVAIELLLLVAIVAGANFFSARHYLRGDWTRGRTFALSEKTRNILRALQKPVDVMVFMLPSGEGANDLYSDVRELLERARRESDQLRVEYIDVDRDPERAKIVAKKFGVSGDDLMAGVIVVDAGTHSKFLTRDELAEYDFSREDSRAPVLKAWKGEQALASALLSVTEEKAPLLCFTQGHGEPAIDSVAPGELGDFAEELKRDHHETRALDLSAAKTSDIPKECDLLAIAGPEQPFGAADVALIEKYLERGGRLLALLGPSLDPKAAHFVENGLEKLLDRFGVGLRDNLVVDEPRLRSSVIAFAVSEGYADHPITSHLMHHRTVWVEAREVRATDAAAKELVHTSDAGWGETDLSIFKGEAELKFDPSRDLKGPVPLGVASEKGGARLVVFGSSQIAANREVLGYNRDLLLSSVGWLLHEAPKVAIGPRTPEHLRLTLDDGQLRHVFWLCVVALPLTLLLLGLGIFWVRRA